MMHVKSVEGNLDSNDILTKIPEHLENILHKAKEFEGTEDELRDFLFHEYAKQALVEDFHDAMYDFDSGDQYFEEEEVEEFFHELFEYSDEEVLAALSVPLELRKVNFSKMKEQLAAGNSVHDVCAEYVKKMMERGYGIGFHTSPSDIRPAKVEMFKNNGDTEVLSWAIKPTEADHRDNNVTMAYYSHKYRHLYKKEGSKYVYIVRTDPTHKTDGNWSRASGLSIIMRIPLRETIDFVEKTVRNNEKALAA